MREAELREHLAVIAERHGWQVEQEVPCGQFGRIDLLLDGHLVVELKMSLVTTREARRALAQTDGYQRWMTDHLGYDASAWLVSPDVVPSVVSRLYSSVQVADVSAFVRYLRTPHHAHWLRAGDRVERLRKELLLSMQAAEAVDEVPLTIDELLRTSEDTLAEWAMTHLDGVQRLVNLGDRFQEAADLQVRLGW